MSRQIPKLSFMDFADVYCNRQVQTTEGLRETLREQIARFHPDGWMLLECQDFCSSRLGELVILPFGGEASHKEVPDHPVSPRGLASDMSIVKAILEVGDLDRDSKPIESEFKVVVESQHNCYVQGYSEESYERQLAAEALCQRWADEKNKPVILYLKRESGQLEFKPRNFEKSKERK